MRRMRQAGQWVTGWSIGKPDMVLRNADRTSTYPETGVVEYTYMIVPTNFKEDMWIQAAEAPAGRRAEMHHVIAFLRPPGSTWFGSAQAVSTFIPERAERGRVSSKTPSAMRKAGICAICSSDMRPVFRPLY